ncbi:LPXTG cell wall anchor domain-containing protein [Streptococcus sp. DD13]|uniref:LPXTG cell wall anchor domain-containing protein n=1 Tax=Streptococcus sp. DD13 TaxID=1777881 RepID=UPI003FA7DE46
MSTSESTSGSGSEAHSQSLALPETGETSSVGLTALGALALIGGAAALGKKKRSEEE